jgi:GNAT superfamily N-acetyltransferase
LVTFSIRRTKPEDAALLPPIEMSAAQLFSSVPEFAWIAEDSVMDADSHMAFVDLGTSWVACDETRKVAAFLVAEATEDALHIREISVHARAQGQGVGAALIEVAVAEASQRRFGSVTLTTFRAVPWNEPYYQRLGFETLTSGTLDARLAALLSDEVSRGFPAGRRCAMRRVLALTPGGV